MTVERAVRAVDNRTERRKIIHGHGVVKPQHTYLYIGMYDVVKGRMEDD